MDFCLFKQTLFNGCADWVSRFNHPQPENTLSPQIEAIYQELLQLEQSLKELAVCRPTHPMRSPHSLTEQQKIIDLAG
jgi:hypothetical protein